MFYRHLTILLLIFGPVSLHAQSTDSDTLFYNNEGQPTESSKADYYKVYFKNFDNGHIIQKSFYSNHKLKSLIQYKDESLTQKVDTSKAYYESEELHWQMVYDQNGLPLELKQYHKNNKLKRTETYKDGQFHKGRKYTTEGKRERFTRFMQPPKYKGGYEKMIAYLNKTIEYPQKAKDMGIVGDVIVSFIVTADGKIKQANVISPVHPLLDKEALRVVRSMRHWRPGITDDKPINARMSIPISFN